LENTSTIENASSLLIFKVRGQGHGDILSFYMGYSQKMSEFDFCVAGKIK
jgi:hypothetical protein